MGQHKKEQWVNMLRNLQLFFLLVRIVNRQQVHLGVIALFLVNALNLLCLPTNIYLSLSLLLLCIILICKPVAAIVFFSKKVQRQTFILVAVSLATSTALVLLYYQWLLQMQPENQLISSFKIFNIKNAMQALAVFYHFVDFKYYFFFLLLFWLISFLKRGRFHYSRLVLPAFCFFTPFFFFFIHGSIIIQRTFLPLLPFFAMVIAAAATELIDFKKVKNSIMYLTLANSMVLAITFSHLLESSKRNNRLSVHEHDLRNHYYLVNFNAREAILIVLRYKDTRPVLVWDDFGGTGISYYLATYQIPFVEYNGHSDFEKASLLLSNNKAETEKVLKSKRIPYKKLLNDENQYTIYLLGSVHRN